MITAWQIYWVMQLDSIGSFFGWFACVGLLVGGLVWIIRRCASSFDDKESKQFVCNTAFAAPLMAAGLLSWIAYAATPSTKTAAMMIVVPAVANNQAIQREAGDLYGIAKDALRELARPKSAENSK